MGKVLTSKDIRIKCCRCKKEMTFAESETCPHCYVQFCERCFDNHNVCPLCDIKVLSNNFEIVLGS